MILRAIERKYFDNMNYLDIDIVLSTKYKIITFDRQYRKNGIQLNSYFTKLIKFFFTRPIFILNLSNTNLKFVGNLNLKHHEFYWKEGKLMEISRSGLKSAFTT